MSTHPSRRLARMTVVSVAFTTSITMAACATAETSHRSGAQWSRGQNDGNLVQVSGNRPLNLLAGSKKRKKARTNTSKLVRGSYICSASGFGQKSRCSKK